jgi:spore maturation protein CgeB
MSRTSQDAPAIHRAPLSVVILGLSITSAWGNGHATTYRALTKALVERGHDVLFLERNVPWYATARDLPHPPFGRTCLYLSLEELADQFGDAIRHADLVILGSYVPDGVAVGNWVINQSGGMVAFYDIDTPVTLAKLTQGDYEYLSPELIPRYDLYLSFTGGPLLARLSREYHAQAARALYCSVDPDLYYPEAVDAEYDLGYLGTYSNDRQKSLGNLLLEPARQWPRGRFLVAGPQYPASLEWPPNVRRMDHLPPGKHRQFYTAQRFTLNVTRAPMVMAGYSPSVRLFEAAACGIPVITDAWRGIGEFFVPDEEIFVCHSADEVLQHLRGLKETERHSVGQRARQRVLTAHTAMHRVATLEGYMDQLVHTTGAFAARTAEVQSGPPPCHKPANPVRPFTINLERYDMTQQAKKTTDHEEIRAWIEARHGAPATVASTAENKEPGILRILFQEHESGDSLKEISWDDFFRKFEEEKLAFLYQDETKQGQPSRFFKFVSRD